MEPIAASNRKGGLLSGSADAIMRGLRGPDVPLELESANTIFRDRSIDIMTVVVTALTDLRDQYGFALSSDTLLTFLNLSDFSNVLKGQYGALSGTARGAIEAHLKVYGWDNQKTPEEQVSSIQDSFAYAKMYWASVLRSRDSGFVWLRRILRFLRGKF